MTSGGQRYAVRSDDGWLEGWGVKCVDCIASVGDSVKVWSVLK